uniref:Uncharacterized protein n=1 Tax=Oryza meridionalis TaxID=40149 RepID=A0A0E0E1Q4_9ORYZ
MAVAAVLVVVEGACRPPLSLSGALPPPLRRPPPSPPPDPMAAVAVVVKEAREMETGTVRWPARRLGQGQVFKARPTAKTRSGGCSRAHGAGSADESFWHEQQGRKTRSENISTPSRVE